MPRRELLTPAQRDELLAFPTDEADLLRHYTFHTHDLAVIRRRRGDHNRLGFAVQLCYVRFPGRLLALGETPYPPILAMAAAQLKVPTGIWSFYAERDQTRREHLRELQEQFGFHAFTRAHYRRFALELAPLADQTHLLRLAREGAQTTVYHLKDFEVERRQATLVAILLDTQSTLIDEILDLHDRMVGSAFAKAKRAYETSFQEAGKAINEKVRLYSQVGQALIEAKEAGGDPFEAIERVIS
jgi:hypothetical protein